MDGIEPKDCKCGNELRYYDGALGYEAIYCNVCGWYADHQGEGYHDTFKKV